MTYFIVAFLALLLIACYVSYTYNRLVKMRNRINEAYALMDVFLRKRADLVPSLVIAVKSYAEHECRVIEAAARKRSEALSRNENLVAETGLGSAISEVLISAEHYPALKASESFLDLQTSISKIEDEIANSREYYNGAVKQYNTLCETFPGNIVAKAFGFCRNMMFE